MRLSAPALLSTALICSLPVAAQTPALQTPTAAPLPASAAASTASARLGKRLDDWALAWQSKDGERYFGFYAPSFQPTQGGLKAWRAQRRAMLSQPGEIVVRLSDVAVSLRDEDRAEISFTQSYHADRYKDLISKTMGWVRHDGEWYIATESGR